MAPELGLGPGGNHGAAQDDQRPDGIGLTLEHGRGQGIGMGFAPIEAVDRKAVPAQGLFDIRVGNQAVPIDGKEILWHGETAAAGDVQLPGQGPEDHGGPNGLDAAVAVFQPGIHDRGGAMGLGQSPGQRAAGGCRHPGDVFHHFRPKMLDIAGKILKAVGPVPDKGFVEKLLLDHYLTQGQGQGAVGAGADGQPLGAVDFGREPCAGDR